MFQRQTDSLGASYCLQLIIITPKDKILLVLRVEVPRWNGELGCGWGGGKRWRGGGGARVYRKEALDTNVSSVVASTTSWAGTSNPWLFWAGRKCSCTMSLLGWVWTACRDLASGERGGGRALIWGWGNGLGRWAWRSDGVSAVWTSLIRPAWCWH